MLKELKSFGSLFDYSKSDSIPLKIERGGLMLGIAKRKKLLNSTTIDGWEEKYSETVKNVERAQSKVNEAKLKVQERRKQKFSKPSINKSEKQEHDGKDNNMPLNDVTEYSIDEPMPAGFTTQKNGCKTCLSIAKIARMMMTTTSNLELLLNSKRTKIPLQKRFLKKK